MKIVTICPSAGTPCGIDDFNKELAFALEELGDEVYVTTETDIEPILEVEPDAVFIQHEYSFYSATDLQRLLVLLRRNKIRKYVILHGWGDDFERVNKVIEGQSDGIIVMNEKFKRRLVERGIEEEKVEAIPMGVRTANKVKAKKTKQKGENDSKNKIIGTFGFLEPWKGFIESVRAVEVLNKNYGYNSTLILTAFSKQNHNAVLYEKELNKTIKESGVNVIRVGQKSFLPIEKVLGTLSVCDCLLYPYSPDLFTYSSSAALRDGIGSLAPIIATDITFFDDVPSIDEDQEEGVIVKLPSTNPEDFASAMHRLFINEELRQQILQNEKRFVERNNWYEIAKQYRTL